MPASSPLWCSCSTSANLAQRAASAAHVATSSAGVCGTAPANRVRSRRKQAILPAEGGPPLKLFEAPAYRTLLDWAPDGRGFYYIQNSLTVSNLWRQPAGGGPPAQVTRFESGRLFNFAWRGDGRALAVARGEERSDALLISDFR